MISGPGRRHEAACAVFASLALGGIIIYMVASFAEFTRSRLGLEAVDDFVLLPGQHLSEEDQTHNEKQANVLAELEQSEVVPEVIDPFHPLLTIALSWPTFDADPGNTGSPADMQHAPAVRLVDIDSDAWLEWWGSSSYDDASHPVPPIVLAMTDPDAPSRDEPTHGEYCHWIATGLRLGAEGDDALRNLDWLVEYRPPGPPAQTGPHRYVFAALVASNGTMRPLQLRAPEDRVHWGYDQEGQGLRDWADEMGLSIIGASFVYAQNDEQ